MRQRRGEVNAATGQLAPPVAHRGVVGNFTAFVNVLSAHNTMSVNKRVIFWTLMVVALIYLLSPFDLIPEIYGPIGYLDDILLMLWIAFYVGGLYKEHLRQQHIDNFQNPFERT
mmetsp:Transcript_19918/g.22161  ORF Transcript_19918/g.22161 Transcript_19918/m.22161 type:complete len:114 (-) Transcript_19918:179-520(-)